MGVFGNEYIINEVSIPALGYEKINKELKKYITDKYKYYFIHIEHIMSSFGIGSETVFDIYGFKDKIDPKYKKVNPDALLTYDKDNCKKLLSNYSIKGIIDKNYLSKDLQKYTSWNKIFKE